MNIRIEPAPQSNWVRTEGLKANVNKTQLVAIKLNGHFIITLSKLNIYYNRGHNFRDFYVFKKCNIM